MLPDHPLDDLARQLDRGRNEFRNLQVHSISTQISGWGIGVPDEKQLCGFGDDIYGKLLCRRLETGKTWCMMSHSLGLFCETDTIPQYS
jgi:hypothetical protein